MLARPELDETSKILMSAADYIEKHGWWCKGHGASPGIKTCLMTSIWTISYNDKAREAADRVTHYLGFEKREEAVKWNDAPERTKEEVVSALREAAYFRD